VIAAHQRESRTGIDLPPRAHLEIKPALSLGFAGPIAQVYRVVDRRDEETQDCRFGTRDEKKILRMGLARIMESRDCKDGASTATSSRQQDHHRVNAA
jgi:hypothetical protein